MADARGIVCPASRLTSVPVDDLIPSLRVDDLGRSIAFYERLGFAVTERREEEGWLLWARLRSGAAELMLALSSEPAHAHDQGVLLYLYARDLDPLHRSLTEAGVRAGAIESHGSPGNSREMRVEDPDGYVLMVADRP